MAQAKELRTLLQQRVVFLDGAMGTELMKRGMPPGVPTEEWAHDNPGILESVHSDYISAGADLILTCTFGGTEPKLGSSERVAELNSFLAETALRASGGKVLVGASMGPTGQLLHPSGPATWKDVYDFFRRQAKVLTDCGMDIFLLETFSDPRELKAAVLAVRDTCPEAFISAQMTFSSSGLTLSGTQPTALAVLVDQIPADAVGVNCGTGPEELLPVVQEICRFSKKPVTAEPNAGLPVDGEWKMSPEKFAEWQEDIAWSGVSLLGGCCGSGPEHVREYVSLVGHRPAEEREIQKISLLTSVDRTAVLGDGLLLAGESINPTGKKRLRDSIEGGDVLSLVSLARAQGRADLIDVNLGLEKLIPSGFVSEVFSRLSIGPPLSVDLSRPDSIRDAFREVGGIALLNSLTASEDFIARRVDILLRHGGYAVLLPIDEKGAGETPAERKKIVQRGLDILRSHGFPAERVIADPLVKPLGTGADAGLTMETLGMFKEMGLLTIAGISNVSHGLPERSGLNSALMVAMASHGLDIAIADVLDSAVLKAHRSLQILRGNVEPVELKLPALDPQSKSPDFMGILKKSIVLGDKRQTEASARELIEGNTPAEVLLEKALAPAMKEVGDLYNRKKLFLPHLIASAEASEILTGYLAPYLEKEESGKERGRVVLASVKGDIHDIGKNLVALFLRNSGFEVIDMGKDVACEAIVESAEKNDADVIALSALMSTTAPEMEKVISMVRSRGLETPVIVGGAVVTSEYAASIGADAYAPNAYSAAREVERLLQD